MSSISFPLDPLSLAGALVPSGSETGSGAASVPPPSALPNLWRSLAAFLSADLGAEAQARVLELAAQSLDRSLAAQDDVLLTLTDAGTLVGRHPDTIGDAVRDGRLTDFGRKNAPRVRAADVQRVFPPKRVAARRAGTYDVAADARFVSGVRRGGSK